MMIVLARSSSLDNWPEKKRKKEEKQQQKNNNNKKHKLPPKMGGVGCKLEHIAHYQ